jgi:long-chain fatty acid transport protein
MDQARAGLCATALVALVWPSMALATAGYFQIGYGLKSKGMGGVGIALPQDAISGAANPAGTAWVGNRLDAGLEWFVPERCSEITSANTLGLAGSRNADGRRNFAVPDFGVSRKLGDRSAIGFTLVGNGGLTRYEQNPLGGLAGSSPAGLELAQVTASPSFALRLGERHTLGVALNFVYQEFSARGLEFFDQPAFTSSVGAVTNRGRDSSTGLGMRIGWLGRMTDTLSLGAAWQPRIRMGRLDHYKGLLADGGRFDVPANYGIGAAWQAAPAVTVAAELQRIDFGVASSGSTQCFLRQTCLLGATGGPGSGWRNTTVLKLGVAWEAAPGVTLRAGAALLRQPIPPSETLINIFAPAVSEKHLTFGATWAISKAVELTASAVYALPHTVHGAGSIPPGPPPGGVGGGEADLRMKQTGLGLSLGWKM